MRIKATKHRFEFTIQNQNASISIRNGPKIDYRGASGTKVVIKRKKRNLARINAKFEVSEGRVTIDLPIRTVSEANCFESWRVKYGRHKEQKRIVILALKPLRDKIKMACKIMLTRFAPDELDKFDNLPMSFKYIVDAICEVITGEHRAGKADSDKRISIACDQIKSNAYGIRIEVTH